MVKKLVQLQVTYEQFDNPIKVYNFEVADWHTYRVSNGGVLVHNICSNIKDDPGLVKAAEEMGKDMRVQDEANNLINQLLKGNENPGIGSKNLFKDIMYLRGRNGARIFYRITPKGIEILGKASKANEQKVINILQKLYK